MDEVNDIAKLTNPVDDDHSETNDGDLSANIFSEATSLENSIVGQKNLSKDCSTTVNILMDQNDTVTSCESDEKVHETDNTDIGEVSCVQQHSDSCMESQDVNSSIASVGTERNDDEYFEIPGDISKSVDEGPSQPRLNAYPKTWFGPSSRMRSFCSNWYSRFPWLEYSVSFDKAYCFACRHFGDHIEKQEGVQPSPKKLKRKKTSSIYATIGFSRWVKAHERMTRHNSSARHLEAMAPWLEETLRRENEDVGSTNGNDLPTSDALVASNNPTKPVTGTIKTSPHASKRKLSRPTKKAVPNENDDEKAYHCPSWCTCENCHNMSRMHECVCCCDVTEIRQKLRLLDNSPVCITNHPGFNAVCLNPWVLQVAYYQHKQDHGDPTVTEDYERYRYIAYCQFVRWCWGFLREDMHIPLPSCVVNRIKQEFRVEVAGDLPALDELQPPTM